MLKWIAAGLVAGGLLLGLVMRGSGDGYQIPRVRTVESIEPAGDREVVARFLEGVEGVRTREMVLAVVLADGDVDELGEDGVNWVPKAAWRVTVSGESKRVEDYNPSGLVGTTVTLAGLSMMAPTTVILHEGRVTRINSAWNSVSIGRGEVYGVTDRYQSDYLEAFDQYAYRDFIEGSANLEIAREGEGTVIRGSTTGWSNYYLVLEVDSAGRLVSKEMYETREDYEAGEDVQKRIVIVEREEVGGVSVPLRFDVYNVFPARVGRQEKKQWVRYLVLEVESVNEPIKEGVFEPVFGAGVRVEDRTTVMERVRGVVGR